MLTRRFEYIVEEGDTLFGIALKFNVPLQTLIEINNLDNPELIMPGQIIEIPVSEEFYQIAELVKRQCAYNKNEDHPVSSRDLHCEPECAGHILILPRKR